MYPNEIRKQAIDLHARGAPVTEIRSCLQIGRSTLYLWLQQADPNHPKTIPRNEYLEKTELERLRVENRIFRTCGCTPSSTLQEKLKDVFRKYFYPTKKAVVKAVDEYVEFYNDYRPHQRLGYLTPNKVEDEYYSQNKTMAISI